MTTTSAHPATTSTAAVDRLLAALESGDGIGPDLFTPDAELDATVPGWRFSLRGAAPVSTKVGEWFTEAGRFEELERRPTPDGEVITYLLTWMEKGAPMAVHHCHVISLGAGGRIARDRFFCGGRWNAARLAEMAAADDAG